MIGNTARKQARIGELLRENFAFRLLYQQNAHHLQRCRADRGLLEIGSMSDMRADFDSLLMHY